MTARWSLLSALAFALALTACGETSYAPEDAPRAGIEEGWPTVPEGAVFGAPTGVAVDSDGRIHVLHRASRGDAEGARPIPDPVVFVFARNGRLLGKWGAGEFVAPQGISIDGEDRVWITDTARHQVVRLDASGQVQLALGERGVAGNDARHFDQPHDIAFDGDRILVSDTGNNRIVVFDVMGDFIEVLSPPGELDRPRSIAVDDDFLYVADSGNDRVLLLDKRTGQMRGNRRQKATGAPFGLAAMGGGWLAVVEGLDKGGRASAILRIYDPEGGLYRVLDAGFASDASRGVDIALGRGGAVYLADPGADRIAKIDISRVPEAADGGE